MTTRVTEAEMADVVRSILARRSSKAATFKELREAVPRRVHLSKADRAKSPSRPGEQLWEQILRNLSSHEHEGFKAIPGGLALQGAVARKAGERTNGRRAHAA